MKKVATAMVLVTVMYGTSVAQAIKIDLARGSDRERQTKARLEQVIAAYDLRKYTFTREVTIEERAINHAFPVLTLNARFADSSDELLCSYIHEQLHWHLREHNAQQQEAVADLRRMYPNAPVGMKEGAETAFSTYGHLVDCYLEIQAARQLIGPERTQAVTRNKGHYTWITRPSCKMNRRLPLLSPRTTWVSNRIVTGGVASLNLRPIAGNRPACSSPPAIAANSLSVRTADRVHRVGSNAR